MVHFMPIIVFCEEMLHKPEWHHLLRQRPDAQQRSPLPGLGIHGARPGNGYLARVARKCVRYTAHQLHRECDERKQRPAGSTKKM